MQPMPDTRERILDAATALIQRRGINAMSFQDLSDAVGIRKASVHHHFPTKDDMLESVLKRYLDRFQIAVQSILASKRSGFAKLELYAGLFVETLEAGEQDKGCLCGMLMADLTSLDDAAVALVRQFVRSNHHDVTRMLREGVADGSVRRSRGSVEETASVILAALEGSLLVARCDGGPPQLAASVRQLLVMVQE
jgi:TetR/AcrR family transcriptional regulator, transcriptional repressor for nem operon